jgi:benzoyl-CoA reductase/2-hydroxyglutaryl-CoA dehydratase subunit BcrC/BadD/HgdB
MGNEARFAFKKFKSNTALKKLMAEHFYELDAAAGNGNQKIAWCTSVGPAELLRAMGFLVFFPENHAAMLGATRTATDCIPVANKEGYSPDVCSYLTSDIGAFIKGETPLSAAYDGISGVPKPDVLVYNTNQCRDVKDWFMWYSRRLRIPCFGVESFRNVDVVTGDHLKAISCQLRQLVPKLEEISGTRFNIDRFRQVVDLSRQCSRLWGEVLAAAATKPSPITFFDGAIHMGPAVIGRGTHAAIHYYEQLLEELRQRVTGGVAAVDDEKYRIYWEGMPIWGKLRDMSSLFSELRACVVASTYCNSWIFSALDPDRPFESMAQAYTELFIVRSDAVKERYIEEMVRFYSIDGVLFHDAKTCPNNSNSRYGMPRRLVEKLGMPTVIIDGDLNDLRLFSEEQSMTRMEAFVEQLQLLGR